MRGKAPFLICSGAASRRGLPYGGSTRFMGVQLGGIGARFGGLRLRCGDWRAAAGGCHCACLMIKPRAAAATVRPCLRPDPGAPSSPFPQVRCLDRSGGPVLPPLSACEMRARPALAVLAWTGDRSPVRGCTTTEGDQVPPWTLFRIIIAYLGREANPRKIVRFCLTGQLQAGLCTDPGLLAGPLTGGAC